MIAPWRNPRRLIPGYARTLLRGLARSNTANPVLPESSRRCAQECSEFHKQFIPERCESLISPERNEQVAPSLGAWLFGTTAAVVTEEVDGVDVYD
jgi:hypothetical protein